MSQLELFNAEHVRPEAARQLVKGGRTEPAACYDDRRDGLHDSRPP